MDRRSRFAYAQARLQARLGQHLDEPEWQRLEGITTLGHFLQRARATALRSWLFSISQQSDLHTIEQQLRHRLLDEIHSVARWQPRDWRPALSWLATLVELPVFLHLQQAVLPAPWLRLDPNYQHLAYEQQALRLQALAQTPFAPLLGKATETHELWPAWQQTWMKLWPVPAQTQAALEQLTPQLILLSGFRAQESRGKTGDPALQQQLHLQFRRQTHQPISSYLYLMLHALELDRLRHQLARLWFSKQQETAA